MSEVTISQVFLGWKPYVLVEIEDEGQAAVEFGGIDPRDPSEFRYLARALRAAAKGARKQARQAARKARKAAKE